MNVDQIAKIYAETLNSPPDGWGQQTACGRQRTWTGKIVSLSDWHTLSDWERHGSTGRMWNGLTRQWEVKP